MKNETRNTPVQKYKLVDVNDETFTAIKVAELTKQEVVTLNYAYGLNLSNLRYMEL